ncbi:MAG: Crp/Fnr family transcriptional regulator, partial [Bacteroidales bacterium]
EEQANILENNLHVLYYKKKDIIFRQDTRAYDLMFVQSGLVKIFKNSRNERNLILKVARNGDYIGLMALFGKKVYEYSAAALTDCKIYHFDYTVFKSVLAENGKFALSFLKFMSIDGLFLFDKLLSQSYKQLPGRVADVLLYFSEEIFHSQNFTLYPQRTS